MTSLRPSLWPTMRWVLIIGGIVVVGVGVVHQLRVHEQRVWEDDRAAADAESDRIAAFGTTVMRRLAALSGADLHAAPDGPCPPGVTGALPVIDRERLESLVADTRDQRAREAWYVAMQAAPYIVVTIAKTSPVVPDGHGGFDGGVTDATLAVGDVSAGRFVCKAAVSSQPTAIIYLHQADSSDDSWGAASAQRQATDDAFTTAAGAALHVIAPTATIATVRP